MSYDLKKPKRNSLETEEIRTWARFYRESVNNPALAHESLKQLDLDRVPRQASDLAFRPSWRGCWRIDPKVFG